MARRKKAPTPAVPPATPGPDTVAVLLANVPALAVFAVGWYLVQYDPPLYYATVQEDGTLEWASFLAYFAAAPLFVHLAVRQRRESGVVPWFLAGVGLFCFVVAMEEISWGQRLFAFRPPDYFLQHNYQQELNLHNIVGQSMRTLVMITILLGYGVVLPVLEMSGPLRRMLGSRSIAAPPTALLPTFLLSSGMFLVHPWQFTNEWVELAMGYGFLLAAVWRAARPGPGRRILCVAWGAGVVLGGAAIASATEGLRGGDAERIALARVESDALMADIGRLERVCPGSRDFSKRVYSFVEAGTAEAAKQGMFAALVEQGMPRERAQYFLDPWNSPYWVRCMDINGREVVAVYSLGPNGRRDSSEWELRGDDIGRVFTVRQGP